MRPPQYLAAGDEAHFTFAKSPNFQVLTKMLCTDQFANLVNWYPHENTEEIWPVEIDAPKDENLFVIYWQLLIWPLCVCVCAKLRKLKYPKIWAKYQPENGNCGQQVGYLGSSEVRIEEAGGGGRGMAGPLLQMRGSRHRLPLLKRPSLLLFLLWEE